MMGADGATPALLDQIADQLGKIFRHMLPGLTVLLAAAASHPSWFKPEYFLSPWNLVVFAGIAVLAGNTWYVFHRYSLHQVIDYIIYRAKKRGEGGYVDWLANHIYRSFHFRPEDRQLREHLTLRSAQVIFVFVTCEVALLFSWGAEVDTFYWNHSCAIRIVALAGLIVGLVQYLISHRLDVVLVERCTSEK